MCRSIKTVLIFLAGIMIVSCTKDNIHPNYNKIKNIRTIQHPGTTNLGITNINYYYNSFGQLDHIIRIDSASNQSGQIVEINQALFTYFYNSNKQVSKIQADGYENEFIYDANQNLKYKITRFELNQLSDTTFYSYSNNLTQTTKKTDNQLYLEYYSKNLDSSFSINLTNNYKVITYNSYSAKNEVIKTTYVSEYTNPKGDFQKIILQVRLYSRVYNSDNYPTMETVNIDGKDQLWSYLTYYKLD